MMLAPAILFSVWVTFTERYWVSFRERRSCGHGIPGIVIQLRHHSRHTASRPSGTDCLLNKSGQGWASAPRGRVWWPWHFGVDEVVPLGRRQNGVRVGFLPQ